LALVQQPQQQQLGCWAAACMAGTTTCSLDSLVLQQPQQQASTRPWAQVLLQQLLQPQLRPLPVAKLEGSTAALAAATSCTAWSIWLAWVSNRTKPRQQQQQPQ
jgi:hypothetical protein